MAYNSFTLEDLSVVILVEMNLNEIYGRWSAMEHAGYHRRFRWMGVRLAP